MLEMVAGHHLCNLGKRQDRGNKSRKKVWGLVVEPRKSRNWCAAQGLE